MRHAIAKLAMCSLLFGFACGGNSPLALAQPPDLVLHGGKIVTVDEDFSIHQAMAIHDGRIVGTGDDDAVLQSAGPDTRRVDLDGKMVLPGLIDSHVHPGGASMHEFDHPIPEMETIADVLQYIEGRAKVLDPGQWIVVRQVFITRLREQRYPTMAELDAAAPDHPVVFSTGPDASVNSLALKLSGIDRDFQVTGAGKIEKDPTTGEPTGILRSASQYLKTENPPSKATQADRDRRLHELLSDYASVGLTGVIDRNAGSSAIAAYQRLRAEDKLPVRVRCSHSLDTGDRTEEIQEEIRRIAAHRLCAEDPMLRIIGVKAFLDGGMLTGSAYMREPWGVSRIYSIDDPRYRGLLYIPHEKLLPIVRTTVESGLQFTAHSVGDGAVHALLDVYQELSESTDIRHTRPCLTHSNFMSREAVQQAARLGVVIDIQPAWLYLDTRTLVAQFGYDRLRYFQPLASIFAAGGTVGGGSDHMQKIGSLRSVNPYNPFLGMWITITRRARWHEGSLHPEEALTRQQAIQFYTINNARLMFMEDEIGSLEPGKRADFVVLDRDLLECPVDEIRETNVLETYIDGRAVFESRRKEVSSRQSAEGSRQIEGGAVYDLIIRGGKIVDGTGNPWFHGDVAVRGEKIVDVGRVGEAKAKRVIDARGLVVAPGFIDIHSHSDWLLLEDGDAQSKIRQGVTTEVLGEGSSGGPYKGQLSAKSATIDGQSVSWTTLGGYLDAIDRSTTATNVASYVGIGNIWQCVMGESFDRPTPEQLDQMCALVDEAMRDGAFGLSSMLAMPPGSLATTDDIVRLCRVVARHGGIYSTHIRNEGTEVFAAVREAIEIGRRAGVPVDIIHIKIADQQYWGRMDEVIALIDEARRDGVNVQSNVYPYTRGNNNLVSIIPPWAHEGGTDKLLERLRDRELREKIKRDIRAGLPGWYNHYLAVGGDWSRMLISGRLGTQNPFEGLTMDRVISLKTRGQDPPPDALDVLFDLLLEEGGSISTVYAHHTEEDMTLALRRPWCSVGSDGSAYAIEGPLRRGNPHPRNFGTFPRLLGEYVRVRGVVTLEDAVRKITSLNAAKLGITDRGLLRAGQYADITLFDPARVIDRATYVNPFHYGEGIHTVIVNAQVVLDDGEHTGARPGRALRRQPQNAAGE